MKIGPLYIADPLLGIPDGPRYTGLSIAGFQIGHWERPRAYALRLKRPGALVNMDESFEKLIHEFEDKARASHREAARLGYKHTGAKAVCNTEAATYLKCAQRLKEEYERHKASRQFSESDNLPPGSKGEPA